MQIHQEHYSNFKGLENLKDLIGFNTSRKLGFRHSHCHYKQPVGWDFTMNGTFIKRLSKNCCECLWTDSVWSGIQHDVEFWICKDCHTEQSWGSSYNILAIKFLYQCYFHFYFSITKQDNSILREHVQHTTHETNGWNVNSSYTKITSKFLKKACKKIVEEKNYTPLFQY